MSSLHLERQIKALPDSNSKNVLLQAYSMYCRGYPTTFSLSALIVGISYAASGKSVDFETLHDLTNNQIHTQAFKAS